MTELEIMENPVIPSEDSKDVEPWKVSLPIKVRGKWIRFSEEMNYRKANCCLVQGVKESGKSALCEALATHYSEQDEKCKIFDLFGSRDGEGLGWLRSPYKDSVLLVHGDSVKLNCQWDTVKVSDLSFRHIEKHKVIITVAGFYSTLREEHNATSTITTLLYSRKHWTEIWTLLLRELANLIYSRVTIGEDQAKAKAFLIFFLREMRHSGYAVCADSIKFTSVDSDIRSLSDYMYFKAQGKEGLPNELKYLYKYFIPFSITRMPTDRFIILSKKGSIGRGYFECPPWHKREHEDMFKIFDIRPDYGDKQDLETTRGRLSDSEHVKIIAEKQTKVKGKPISYPKLAARTGRSLSTVYNVVQSHNEQIESLGFCEVCKRMTSPLETVKV